MTSIKIYDHANRFVGSERASNMREALRSAIITAETRASAQAPEQFLRDCLGGLRAEVCWRDGEVSVRRT